MFCYRFFTVDEHGRVIDMREAACADDEEARALARGFATGRGGIEIWEAGRRLCRAAGESKKQY